MTMPNRMRRWITPTLMLITDGSLLHGRALEEVVSQAVDGGVTAVQLREKDLPAGELREIALTLRAVLRGRALLLINEHVDVAMECGADGVHLPEQGPALLDVRKAAGEGCIVGRSVHGVLAAVEAQRDGADYVVAGPIYETETHPGTTPLGIEGLRAIAESVRIPVVAVGGIDAARVQRVIEAGASGVAVIRAVLAPEETAAAAASLSVALHGAHKG